MVPQSCPSELCSRRRFVGLEDVGNARRMPVTPRRRSQVEVLANGADNSAMQSRRLSLVLILVVLVQSCWAVGEWLHTDNPHETMLTVSTLNADLHHEAGHSGCGGSSRPSDTERNHHHSCFTHSPFALPVYLFVLREITEAFARPNAIPRSTDAPSKDIDRPNWRSRA